MIGGSPIPSSSFYNVPIEIDIMNMFSIEDTVGVAPYNHEYNQFYNGNQKYSLNHSHMDF